MAFGEMFAVIMMKKKGECNVEDNSEFNYLTDFCSYQTSFSISYGLFVRGLNLGEVYTQISPVMRSISFLFGFLVTIILLNVAITMASSSWAQVASRGKEVVSIVISLKFSFLYTIYHNQNSNLSYLKFWTYRLSFLMEVHGY